MDNLIATACVVAVHVMRQFLLQHRVAASVGIVLGRLNVVDNHSGAVLCIKW